MNGGLRSAVPSRESAITYLIHTRLLLGFSVSSPYKIKRYYMLHCDSVGAPGANRTATIALSPSHMIEK